MARAGFFKLPALLFSAVQNCGMILFVNDRTLTGPKRALSALG